MYMNKSILLVAMTLIASLTLTGCFSGTQEPKEESELTQEQVVPTEENTDTQTAEEKWEMITFDNFTPWMSITSPYTITWKAKRSWFTNKLFDVVLISPEDETISLWQAIGESQEALEGETEMSDNDMIDFRTIVEFTIPDDFSWEATIKFSPESVDGEDSTVSLEQDIILTQ